MIIITHENDKGWTEKNTETGEVTIFEYDYFGVPQVARDG